MAYREPAPRDPRPAPSRWKPVLERVGMGLFTFLAFWCAVLVVLGGAASIFGALARALDGLSAW